MGKVAKGKLCDVLGCSKLAVRSIHRSLAVKSGLNIGGQNRVYLCKEHYKVVKKRFKKERMLTKWRHMAISR